ncbi:autotransporter outer membrane beta-barrel domain-containing protein [Enterobacter mori]|uniref:autotransporter outer membrane beta-barrel domain-containing protein n=1 Tax=Enterobacter mori TaxID=539813 RepID=UPI001BDFE803|nr:autotransporter outer membrane beta-barrel domain-containing protein [Enterobacter mori]MBT1872777.1 autotransporter outer membrane beta-barrel domain-containing protein [Enterobacter mori]HBM8320059.1 autotransporter outer membrane beta-barrel domain-containing protein [Enterobacter cloacae]
MNKIYRVVWNESQNSWSVVSELGKGKVKSSSKSNKIISPLKLNVTAAFLAFLSSSAYALELTGNQIINSSSSINDGLQWSTTAALEISNAADVVVTGGDPTIDMLASGDPIASTSLWLNSGNLQSQGNLQLGNNSFIQIGGRQLGGDTGSQQGGGAGLLQVGDVTTSTGATNFTLWMFGSTENRAKFVASNLILTANDNSVWLASPGAGEEGADIEVTGDFTLAGQNTSNFLMTGNSQLSVGGNLYLDTTNGGMLITNNGDGNGVSVGGDLTLINNANIDDINGVNTDAGIYSTEVNVGGDLNILGRNVGFSGLQILNATGNGITVEGDVNITSEVSDNTTNFAVGHFSNLTVGGNVLLSSVAGGKTNLLIGNTAYGAPTNFTAKQILMSGLGENKVVFNNNIPPTPGQDGYVFNVPINGEGVVENQAGHTTLVSSSEYSGGTLISGGLLSIKNSGALGSGDVVINTSHDNSLTGLDLAYSDGTAFNNILSGNGNTTVSGMVQVTGDNRAYTGNWNITGEALTNNTASSSQDNFGNGVINVEKNGVLSAETETQFSFENTLTGNGTLIADNNHQEFTFSSSTGSEFAGDVVLKNNTFALGDINTGVLTNAKLHIGEGNTTTVGTGTQNIGGLSFDGGTMVFGAIKPGDSVSNVTIKTKQDLDLTGSGRIQVAIGSDFENSSLQPDTTRSLLEQDDSGVMVKLADSEGTVTGSAGNIELIDQNGDVVSDQTSTNLWQGGEIVANGVYDYRLTSGDDGDGLYINYGLKEIELLVNGENALSLNAEGHTGNASDLSAKVTGSGDLAFNSLEGQTVTLSNSDNDYSGITDVRSGNLAMLNDNVLGNTSELKLANKTGFDMRGHDQTIGKLAAESGSLIDLNDGHLTLLDGGDSSGVLAGEGLLTVAGGNLNVKGANTELKASTTIAQNATVTMDDTLGLGTGNILAAGLLQISNTAGTLYNSISDNGKVSLQSSDVVLGGNNNQFSGAFDIDDRSSLTVSSAEQLGSAAIQDSGTLVLSTDEDWSLDNSVSGTGDVVKNGSGNVTIGTEAQWTGTTDINSGGLILGDPDKAVMLTSEQVNIQNGGFLSGYGGVEGNVDNKGAMFVGTGISQKTIEAKIASTNVFTIGGNLTNSGAIWTGTGGGTVGNQLIINGNYHGDNGHIYLNTALNNDSSLTDKVIVNGDTSGTTNVSVKNIGGSGAQTLNGIEVIHVEGNSDGNFIQDGRIVAGAYDYSLVRGEESRSSNWYLTSNNRNPTDPGVDPTDPGVDPTDPGGNGGDIRPEAGSYTANLAAVNTLFTTRLHDRVGESQYIDVLTGEKKATSMWLRQVGGHNNWKDSSGQLRTQSNSYVMQLGGDVARWSSNSSDSWRIGLMAGYGNNSNNTHSSSTGYSSKGSVNGYSAGIYTTWFANDETKNGAYLDAWAQYGWFNNNVKGQDLQGESYKSSGATTSLELGYTKKSGEFRGSFGSKNEVYIQPQAQIIWMGVTADDHREANGTRISGVGDNNVQTRLGLRTYIKGRSAMDNKSEREFQPFIEANWIHNTNQYGTKMDGVKSSQDGASNLGEIKTGLEAKINKELNLWGNVAVQVGDKGYNNSSATIGFKYQF